MTARRIILALLGGVCILIGTVLLVLPGPGLLLIALGIMLLSLEFEWARNIVNRFRRWAGGRRRRLPPTEEGH